MATTKRRKPGRARAAAAAADVLTLVWNAKQAIFLKAQQLYVNLEGGVRAGKSFVLCWLIFFYCRQYPSIYCALTRWTQDGLDAQLAPMWRTVCRMAGVVCKWNAREEYDEFPNGSRVYLRALKSSEDTQRYSKLAGLTLAILGIDQAEEVPEDVFRHYVPARLSQPGYPHRLYITPNPPGPGHWIATLWPETAPVPGQPGVFLPSPDHLLIQTTLYDNRAVLGEDYVRTMEAAYEPGSLEHRRLVQGKRGLVVAGTPVYARHVDPTHMQVGLEADRALPLYAAIDFGTRHPCVVWAQFPPGGRVHLLGGVMGDQLSLDEFYPHVEAYAQEWFGDQARDVRWTCDPAGQAGNSHGSRSGVQILQDFNVHPLVMPDANHPPTRAAAVEVLTGYLRRRASNGGVLCAVNPRFVVVGAKGRTHARHDAVIQQLLEGGYCYDAKRNYYGTTYPHLQPLAKDGWYEHPANCIEYLVTAFAPPDAAAQAGVIRNAAAEQQARKLLRQHPELAWQIAREQGVRAVEDINLAPLGAELLARRQTAEADRERRRKLREAQRDTQDRDPSRGRDSWGRPVAGRGYFSTARGGRRGRVGRAGY